MAHLFMHRHLVSYCHQSCSRHQELYYGPTRTSCKTRAAHHVAANMTSQQNEVKVQWIPFRDVRGEESVPVLDFGMRSTGHRRCSP